MRAFIVATILLVASAVTPAFSVPIEYAVGTCNLAIFTDLFVAFVRAPLTPRRATLTQAGDSKGEIPSFAIFTDLFVALVGTLTLTRNTTPEAREKNCKAKIPSFYAMATSARWGYEMRKTLSEPIYSCYFSDSMYGDLPDFCTTETLHLHLPEL
jgi:hypothetical protein